jgi:hypothetical protein
MGTAALIYGPCLLLLAASVAIGSAIDRRLDLMTVLTLLVLAAVASLPWEPILFVLAVVSLIWYAIHRQRRRAAAMRARASALGFEFLGNLGPSYADRTLRELGPFAFFGQGDRRFLWNRMRGARDGYDLALFDYAYTFALTTSRSSRKGASGTVVWVAAPSLRLPTFRLQPRFFSDTPDQAAGFTHPAEFERHPRFTKDYILHGAGREALAAAFPETALAFFAQSPGWYVESLGDRVIVHREEDIAVDRLDTFLNDVLRVVRALEGRPP